MIVDVVAAHEADLEILSRLLQLYLYDCADFNQADVGEDGQFGSPSAERGWLRPGLFLFLIRVDGKLAGFALVEERQILEPGAPRYTMADFFVLRKYRRRGVGGQAASDLFGRLPGSWLVQEDGANTAAQTFWRVVIGDYTEGQFEEKRYGFPDRLLVVAQRFDSPG